MENFDQIFTLIAENEGISLNLDILETGVINIVALIAILIYVGKDFLGSILEKRKNDIITSVQDAEERLNEANKRLAEAEKQLTQAYIIIDESQGLTQFQLKSIITRVGVDSRIVVLGNLAQIDNKYISPLTSGLTYLVEKSKPYPHAGIMHVNGIVRSRLAAFAEENL